jgi:hypothetical protein
MFSRSKSLRITATRQAEIRDLKLGSAKLLNYKRLDDSA